MIFYFLFQQVRRSRPPTPVLPVSSLMAAPGSCCNTLRIPMDFVFTWKVNTAVLSPHAWVGLHPLVGVQTAPRSLPFMAFICLQMPAPSTSSASLARAQVDGTASEQEVSLAPVVLLLWAIISVSLQHHPSSAPLRGTTWMPTT